MGEPIADSSRGDAAQRGVMLFDQCPETDGRGSPGPGMGRSDCRESGTSPAMPEDIVLLSVVRQPID